MTAVIIAGVREKEELAGARGVEVGVGTVVGSCVGVGHDI